MFGAQILIYSLQRVKNFSLSLFPIPKWTLSLVQERIVSLQMNDAVLYFFVQWYYSYFFSYFYIIRFSTAPSIKKRLKNVSPDGFKGAVPQKSVAKDHTSAPPGEKPNLRADQSKTVSPLRIVKIFFSKNRAPLRAKKTYAQRVNILYGTTRDSAFIL